MKHFLARVTLWYLRFWARKALKKHNPTIIGIAGSVGKSSTRNALEAILKDHFRTQSVGNSETGIPLGILGMKPETYSLFDWMKMLIKSPFHQNYLKGTQYLIAEMGIDDPYPPKNMEYLLTILQPNIAVILNESATHTMQFEKVLTEEQRRNMTPDQITEFLIQKITEEDLKILTQKHYHIGIYNADNYFIRNYLTTNISHIPGKLLSFGETGVTDISFGTYQVGLQGTRFQLFFRQNDRKREITLVFPQYILPKEYREIFAASILAAIHTGLTINEIIVSLQKNFVLPKGRSSLFKGISDSIIIDSSYNASKASTLAFLQLVKALKIKTKRPVVFLFGDMRELGNESRTEHEAVVKNMIGIVDHLYLVGQLTRKYVLPVVKENENKLKEVRWFATSLRAGEFMKNNLPKGAIVLVKGSQNTIFLEEAIKYILADKRDANNLCRQSKFWHNLKKEQLRSTV